MSIKSNVTANYIGTFFVVLAPLLALPYYLHALGSSVWGLVSFITTLQALLSILDAGASQSLVREFAKNKPSASENQFKLGLLLYGFERGYWIFAIVAGLIVLIFSHQIIHQWLKINPTDLSQGTIAIYGAVAIFIVQFPSSVYRSLLVGTQAQVMLNLIMSLGALTKHVGGVVVVLIWPTLLAYIIWQVFSVAMETGVRFFYAWSIVNIKRSEAYWDSALMKSLSLPIITLSGAALLGALTLQIDKIILSGMVAVEKFGYYVIASSLAIGCLQILYPVINAAIPRAVELRNNNQSLRDFNFKYAKFVMFLIFMIGTIFYFIGYDFLEWWLKSSLIAEQVYELLRVLLIGTALNAIYTIGYINWIVRGRMSRIFQVNLISLIISAITIPILVVKFGTVGATFGWIAINTIGLFFSLGWALGIDQE